MATVAIASAAVELVNRRASQVDDDHCTILVSRSVGRSLVNARASRRASRVLSSALSRAPFGRSIQRRSLRLPFPRRRQRRSLGETSGGRSVRGRPQRQRHSARVMSRVVNSVSGSSRSGILRTYVGLAIVSSVHNRSPNGTRMPGFTLLSMSNRMLEVYVAVQQV
jgi:hypothetical protein